MADSTINDVGKMKVVDLRKELKLRGLPHTGDKAELVSRLQSAIAQEDNTDINLDSDEIDSDGVLEDEDDKSQNDILDDSAVDTLSEEMAFADQPTSVKIVDDLKPQKALKRKITLESKETNTEPKHENDKNGGSKKIVLNRSTSSNPTILKTTYVNSNENMSKNNESMEHKLKTNKDLDLKTRLELRAKRFGLPIKMTEAERKEARKQRFGQNTPSNTSSATVISKSSLADNLLKLKKRSERFGQSVSKIMSDIENKERLERRKAKFGIIDK